MLNQTQTFDTLRLWNEKRYHTWNYHLRSVFSQKVFKVALDGGFSCPNRDGNITTGGCTFCSPRGSGDFAGRRRDDLVKQFHDIKTRMHQKWPEAQYLGYFQAFSNTYAPVEELRQMYEAILEQEGVVGLSIATRPDCLPDDVVEYLAELNQRTYLWVELGLQTIHEKTSDLINRAHDFQCFVDGVDKLRKHGINTCVHIIHGLPQETEQMMLETVEACAHMDIQGIKIHLLHLLKKTPMMKQFEEGLLEFLDRDQYVKLVCDSLEMLPPDVIIQRITGDGPPNLLVGPMWSTNKWDVLNGIDKEMKLRNSWQGKRAVVRNRAQLEAFIR
ncbi:TIGR01212 family radical SAM protein [Risungbinella massiliensis]|uniref:TIGR01212 family radical SAM protein n=1 Tax=Risungbinella massiliensis TaxID=1329796 RepID=UPI0005CBDB66|nr:TIGR01212 family radical SAM protein [Risungbinella massiliensis]